MKIKNESGLLIDEESGCACGYLFDFTGHGIFSPDGKVEVSKAEANAHNRLLSEALLTGLDQNCQIGQGNTFYYSPSKGVTTWTGETVSERVQISGQSITFWRQGKTYRGRLQKDADCFNFRRVK